jgi:hypothetical protein
VPVALVGLDSSPLGVPFWRARRRGAKGPARGVVVDGGAGGGARTGRLWSGVRAGHPFVVAGLLTFLPAMPVMRLFLAAPETRGVVTVPRPEPT